MVVSETRDGQIGRKCAKTVATVHNDDSVRARRRYRRSVGRVNRDQTPGYRHVFSRGTGAAWFFVDDEDRRFFLQILERTSERLSWTVQVYCLMTTHYHLVIHTQQPNLSIGLQRLNSSYVRAFNARWERFGTLVAGRFGCRTIEDERYLETVCRYVLLNPVRANLCDHPSKWPWSGGAWAEVAFAEL